MAKPAVDLRALNPRRSGSGRIEATFTLESKEDGQAVKWHTRLTRHRRGWFDATVASDDGEDVLDKGQRISLSLDGRCEPGKNTYFAKITAQRRSFSDVKESKSEYVEVSC